MDEDAIGAPVLPAPAGLHDWYYWWSCYDCMQREAAVAIRRPPSRPMACRMAAASVTMWGWVRINWRESRRDPPHDQRHSRRNRRYHW